MSSSRRNWTLSWVSTLILQNMRSSCAPMRRVRSRRWTAHSPDCRSKKGRCGTMTHDYKRNGTATLFAALDALDGTVISMCDDRHRHQEWLKFLRVIDDLTPRDKHLHLIADNYATHKHPKVQRW